jgi:hypothetical protein
MGRCPGVVGGNRHTCLMVSLKEGVSKLLVILLGEVACHKSKRHQGSRSRGVFRLGHVIRLFGMESGFLSPGRWQGYRWVVHSVLLRPFLPSQSST